MMTTHAWNHGILRRIRSAGTESGVALVVVVGTMLVLASLATVTLTYTLAGQKFARYDQDYAAAMNAAQAGLDDFVSRMNRDETYGTKVDCANGAWQGPMPGASNTCGWNDSTAAGWLPVKPGDTDPLHAQFHYGVDATNRTSTGTVTLQVTGRVNGVYRTLETAVGKGGSTDYVYYTDYESADPSNVQAYSPSTTAGWSTAQRNACGLNGLDKALYWYEKDSSGKTRANYGCVEITFITDDTLDGAVFTNDTILSSGAHFLKGVETATPSCANATSDESTWNSACLRSGSTADFNHIKPLYEQPLYLADNSASFATNPGCHYFGSTRVIFNENGTMTVWNSSSVNGGKAPVAIAPPGGTAPECGNLTDLNNPNGDSLPVPSGMVIYADASSVANRQCYADEIGGPSGRQLPLGTYNASSTNPPTGSGQSYTYDVNMAEATKKCGNGNLYAEGVLKGQVTIAASSSVVVTGDLVLAGGLNGSDMLGLVATNSVEVFHPRMVTVSSVSSQTCYGRTCTYTYQWGNPSSSSEADQSPYNEGTWPTRYKASTESSYTPTTGIQIAGSIQTLQHSFLVQQYSVGGDQGTLLVNGSIAQRWRGIVGQGSSGGGAQNGYSKLYKYDTRLIYTRPPYFPTWANSKWQQRYSGEVKTPAGVKG